MSFLRNSVKLLLLSQNVARQQCLNQTRSVKRWVAPTLREQRVRKNKLGPAPPEQRSGFVEWNYKSELFAFGKRLKEDFDLTKLQVAFVSRSYILKEELRQRELGIEDPKIDLVDNSQLVKKGEQLVFEYVRAFLEFHLPNVPSEGINAFSNYLQSTNILSHVSSHLGVKDLCLSGEYPPTEETLRNTLLAVIGALQESSGDDRAYTFIRDFICTQLNQKDLTEIWEMSNSFDRLKTYCKELKMAEPEPRLIGHSAQNTVLATAHVGIYSNKNLIGKGFGEDIQTAIETASLDALRTFYGITENMKPFNFTIELQKSAQQDTKKQIN